MTTTRYKTMALMLSAFGLALSPVLASADPASDSLRGRVEDELLSDGISLARLGQRLELRTAGTALEAVLVERDTGKVIASRTVDKLPADPAAAVAQLTVVVSDLLRERGLATAAASNWTATFAPAAVVAYHRPASVAVVAVAKPGRAGAETRAAAAALVAAYRASGVALVDDGRTLGEVGESEDEAIVTRAASLSVEKIAIVRAFVEGPTVRAIVTLYGADRQLITGFSGVAGQALAAPVAPPTSDGSVADQIMRTRANPGEPSLDKDGVVRLWIEPNDPQLQLLRTQLTHVTSTRGVATVGFSNIVCRAPCGEVVDGSLGESFTFGVEESARTQRFQLVGWKGDVTAHVTTVNRGLYLTGTSLMGIGVSGVVLGGVFKLIESEDSHLKSFNTAVLVSGAISLVAGYLFYAAGKPKITLTHGRPK